MLLRTQLLQEKGQKEMLEKQKIKDLAEKMYAMGRENLINKFNQSNELSYGVNLISGREAKEGEVQYTDCHLRAVPYIAEMAIEDGIDFQYNSGVTDFIEPWYVFEIVEYSDDYMDIEFKACKRSTKVENYGEIINESAGKYFEYEAMLFSKLKEVTIDKAQAIYEKTLASVNIEDIDTYRDAFENAIYRLGFDEFEPTYSKYCAPDYATYLPIFQKVHNCTEILHRVNKEKRLQEEYQPEEDLQPQKTIGTITNK